LNRITPIFDDLDGEEKRAARTSFDAIPAYDEDDHDPTVEAAYEHALEHVMQFMEMHSRKRSISPI
jgi:hypothetical protein